MFVFSFLNFAFISFFLMALRPPKYLSKFRRPLRVALSKHSLTWSASFANSTEETERILLGHLRLATPFPLLPQLEIARQARIALDSPRHRGLLSSRLRSPISNMARQEMADTHRGRSRHTYLIWAMSIPVLGQLGHRITMGRKQQETYQRSRNRPNKSGISWEG